VVKLVALSPCAGLLPVTIGTVTLTEVMVTSAVSVAPFSGQAKKVSTTLKRATGAGFPEPGQALAGKDGARNLWIGPGRALVLGATLPDLAGLAALVDQSDSSAVIHIAGPDSLAVLARLVPMDLRPKVFPVGQTARTLLGHMTVSVTRTGDDALDIMAFRSMAGTLVHELTEAAQHVAARAVTP
jgi:sarcosine oxidase, subunit gamma